MKLAHVSSTRKTSRRHALSMPDLLAPPKTRRAAVLGNLRGLSLDCYDPAQYPLGPAFGFVADPLHVLIPPALSARE
jgi:hypothetical protein